MTATARPVHLLTVLHAAELSGPPLFALQFLRWLRAAEPTWQLSTLFLDVGGPLEESFATLGPVTLAQGRAPYSAGRSVARRALTLRAGRDLRRELVREGPIDLAHVHCVGSLKVLPVLTGSAILGHLHELSVGLDLHLGPRARRHAADAHRYVAVSEGVRTQFLERFDVAADRVERQWGFVDPGRLVATPDRSALGLPAGAFVVAASGVRHWRKGPELFVRVATRARHLAPEVPWHFVWIGGEDEGDLESLVARGGLGSLVRFLPHQPDPLAWIGAADVFALTAREDAFPLVCVEAAAAGTPIATFENGGAAELVRAAGCGIVAPFLDVEQMAADLVALAREPDRAAGLGAAGRAFAADNLLIEHAGPRLLDALRRTLVVAR